MSSASKTDFPSVKPLRAFQSDSIKVKTSDRLYHPPYKNAQTAQMRDVI